MFGVGPTKPGEPYFFRGLWGWLTSTWVKLGILFGWSDHYEAVASKDSGAGGNTDVQLPAIGSGVLVRVENLCVYHSDGTARVTNIYLNRHSANYIQKIDGSLPIWDSMHLENVITLHEGDYLWVRCNGMAASKTVTISAIGYKVKVT